MTKILISRLDMLDNMGATSLLIGMINSLKNHIPNVEIELLSSRVNTDIVLAERLGIKLYQDRWKGKSQLNSAILILCDYFRSLFCHVARVFSKRVKSPYAQFDVIIDSNEDTLNELTLGSRVVTISLVYSLLEKIVFRKPMATTPTDIGPFVTRRNRWLARFVLNKLNCIALREKPSYDYALQLGLKKSKVSLTADSAFLLAPAPRERAETIFKQEEINLNSKPLIGFSPNWLEMELFAFSETMSRNERRTKYISLMAALIDHIAENFGATICFVPFVRTPSTDDREVCNLIIREIKNKEAVRLLRGNYFPDEIKGVIKECDMYVGCRMHSTIAATSQGVPTLAIAYADKFYRIIGETMGQKEYIVDIRDSDSDKILAELKSKLDSLWENKVKVKGQLQIKAKIAQEQALFYGQLIKDLVESSKNTSAFGRIC